MANKKEGMIVKIKDKLKHINLVIFCIKKILSISKLYFYIIIFSAVFNSMYNILITIMVKNITSNIITGNYKKFTSNVLLMFFLSVIISAVNGIIKKWILPRLDIKINNNLERELYNSYFKENLYSLYTTNYYDDYYYQLKHTSQSLKGIVGLVGTLVTNILSIIGIGALFINYNLLSILILFVGVIISFACSIKEEKINYSLAIELNPDFRKLNYVERVFYEAEYAKELRLNNKEIFFSEFKKIYKKIDGTLDEYGKRLSLVSIISELSGLLANYSVVIIIGITIILNRRDVSTFAMLYTGINKISSQLSVLFSSLRSMFRISFDINKFKNFIENKEAKYKSKIEITSFKTIEFNNVSFKMNGIEILKNINLNIRNDNNPFIILGRNGSGKSTLLNLMTGLFPIQSGSIKINNINIDEIDRNELQSLFSILFQDFQIFSLSILENISMKKEINDVELNKILYILRVLGLYDKINSLQHGINTVLSNEFTNAMKLSQGEMQRIAFARAWFKNSKIIILDEPSSFVDIYFKEHLNEIIAKLSKDKFVIIVTHDDQISNITTSKYILD